MGSGLGMQSRNSRLPGRFLEMRVKISAHRDQLALLVELLAVYGNPSDDTEI